MFSPNEFADFIWNIKELIRDEYSEKDYEDVILPFTLLRRLDCVLEKTQNKVDEAFKKYSKQPPGTLDRLLTKAAGQPFYNTSGFTLSSLTKIPADLGENFDKYLKGFSNNIKDILYNFSGGEEKGLSPIYETLLRKDLLLVVTKEFTNIDLHPEVVDNHDMGTIFEILIRKAKETTNEKAGQYYTPREIVKLMVNLVFTSETEKLQEPGKGVMIYDPCCGTGGMLTTAKEHLLKTINPKLDVYLFGQEINEQTYAIAKSDMLMKGEKAENIKHGNTITRDKLLSHHFNYMLTNPPFGDDWKNIREFVEEEAKTKGYTGRFGAGTPDVSDGSFLFLQHMISKMDARGSKIAIVFNGSPLFNGDAGGGWSNIRGWIMDDLDLLDCIVALPKDLFYATNISTYVWILNNRKPETRKGKVLLINGIHKNFYSKLRRSIGKKQVEISEAGIKLITEMYQAFENKTMDIEEEDGSLKSKEVAKVFNVEDFKYTKVTVERPLRLAYDINDERIENLKSNEKFINLASSKKKDPLKAQADIERGKQKQREILTALDKLKNEVKIMDDRIFFEIIADGLSFKLNKQLIKLLRDALGEKDEDAKEVFENPFDAPTQSGAVWQWQIKPLPDSDLRDAENIPWKTDIEEYFKTEVLPFVPDAWMDRSKDKIGYEIPFTKYFYEYKPLRDLEEIMADIEALEDETENLLREIKDE